MQVQVQGPACWRRGLLVASHLTRLDLGYAPARVCNSKQGGLWYLPSTVGGRLTPFPNSAGWVHLERFTAGSPGSKQDSKVASLFS